MRYTKKTKYQKIDWSRKMRAWREIDEILQKDKYITREDARLKILIKYRQKYGKGFKL